MLRLVYSNGWTRALTTNFKIHIVGQSQKNIPFRVGSRAYYVDDKNRLWQRPLNQM